MAERTHTTVRQLSKEQRLAEREGKAGPKRPHWRPKIRADCVNMPRPCPYYGCRYHLGLDVTYAGSVRMPFGGDMDAMTETCALDVAETGPKDLETLGRIMNYNKERVRQVLLEAMDALKTNLAADEHGAEAKRQGERRLGPNDGVLRYPDEPLG